MDAAAILGLLATLYAQLQATQDELDKTREQLTKALTEIAAKPPEGES